MNKKELLMIEWDITLSINQVVVNAGGGHGFGAGNFHDIFGDFFNDVMGGRGREISRWPSSWFRPQI
jgi:DnaJ-class molecular chaperone